jgi:hypothetical protein
MKARFHQPGGAAARRRLVCVGLVALCATFAWPLAIHAGSNPRWYALTALVMLSLVALFTALLIERRCDPIDATLDLLPGMVVVRDLAGRVQAILGARSIVGATTARLGDGVSLVLAHKPLGQAPAVLHLADEADADRVRRSLGIGPGGFGHAQWSTGPAQDGAVRTFTRVAWRVLLGLTVLFAAMGNGDTSFLLGLPVFAVGLCALGMRLTQGTEPPFVRLSSRGVTGHVRGADRRWKEVDVGFSDIRSVEAKHAGGSDAIVLDCGPSRGSVVLETRLARSLRGLDAEEVTHIVAQIQAAAERARQPSFVAEKASRLELLRRGDATWGEWLVRLDALGQSLRGAHHYRSTALDEADLWNALETPELDAELRTAAARVLVQAGGSSPDATTHDERLAGEDARERVLATVSAERSPLAGKRIRIALEPDAQLAALELEELERRHAGSG